MHKVIIYVTPGVRANLNLCQQTFSLGIKNCVGQNLSELCNLYAIVPHLGKCPRLIVFRWLICIENSNFYPPEFREVFLYSKVVGVLVVSFKV